MMTANGSSSVATPQELSGQDIPPDDLQKMVSLYQKYPKLWGTFRNLSHVVNLMTTKSQADDELLTALMKTQKEVPDKITQHESERPVIDFISASGFVEKSVSFSRQTLHDMGRTYITEFPALPHLRTDIRMACVYYIRCVILNSTCYSPEFSLRLCQTGFLVDLLEDVKHIQHMSLEALERGKVLLLSLGTIQNCCMYPQTAAMVKQLDVVPHVAPFLTKRGDNYLMRLIALTTAAHNVEDDQLDLLILDAQLLQFSLKNIQITLTTDQTGNSNCILEGTLFDFHMLARNDFNKRLMVSQGTLRTVCSVLEPHKKRSAEEKKHAVAVISRLIEDRINHQICQKYQELIQILKSIKRDGASDNVRQVCDILRQLENHDTEDLDDRISAFPHVSHLLADQANVLTILNMGLVEFVLDELKDFTEERGHRSDATAAAHGPAASCRQVLLALSELADDDVYGREIMSRGGLTMVRSVLQRGSHEDKMEAARIILTLSMAPENRAVMQIDADLMTLMAHLEQRADNKELAQLAENILLALRQ